MTASRAPTVLVILAIGPLLGGCAIPLASQPVMSATWVFLLAGFFSVVYLANTLSQNRLVVISATFISSLIVSTLIATAIFLGLLAFDTKSEFRKNRSPERHLLHKILEKMFPKVDDIALDALVSSVLFILAIVLGIVLALVLTLVTPWFPRLPPYVFFISMIPLAASFAFWGLFRVKDHSLFFVLSSLSLWVFGIICSGSLIAIGFVAPQILSSLGLLIIGFGGLANLAMGGLSVVPIQAKIAIYTTSFILVYELWIVIRQVLVVWENEPIRLFW